MGRKDYPYGRRDREIHRAAPPRQQGEFVAIMNAIAMQLESQKTVPEVVRLLGESVRALAVARGFEERYKRRLDQRLDELIERVRTLS